MYGLVFKYTADVHSHVPKRRYFFTPSLPLLLSKDINEIFPSLSGVTAYNRFTCAKIITNLISVGAGLAAIAERGGGGERESIVYI